MNHKYMEIMNNYEKIESLLFDIERENSDDFGICNEDIATIIEEAIYIFSEILRKKRIELPSENLNDIMKYEYLAENWDKISLEKLEKCIK